MSEKSLKEEVENKFIKYTFHAKNFSKDEMDYVDEYCKIRYDNNRKIMVLDLIRYKEENMIATLLNEKIEQSFEYLNEEIEKLKPKTEEEPKKKTWKGFTRD